MVSAGPPSPRPWSSIICRASSLHQEMEDAGAHRRGDVKKLSKQRDKDADHMQTKSISSNVCINFPDVRHSPSGLPKYSNYCYSLDGGKRRMENTHVYGKNNVHKGKWSKYDGKQRRTSNGSY